MKLIRTLPFFLLMGACLDRLDVSIINAEPQVVVDGMISNEPGPYVVNLSWSLNPDDSLESAAPVERAIVVISDDVGNAETLTENPVGSYKTRELQGVLGRKYKLSITTEDGVVYESTPAVLQPAGEITELYFEYKENVLNPSDPLLPQNALAIYVDGVGKVGNPNLFRWRWSGIFHITTYPWLRTTYINVNEKKVKIPFPEPCSGYIYDGGELTRVSDCTCCDCWITQKGSRVSLTNNAVSDLEFKRVQLHMIPIDKWFFDDKYYFEVEQISIQSEVYNFWKMISIQQESTGNIFQPNAGYVRGNMRCISDTNKKVHGIFSVSAITKKSFFIKRSDIPKPIPFHSFEVTDCADYFKNSAYQKPTFW